MKMGILIKQARLKMGYTQEELAEMLGLKKSAIAKYENGRVENIKRSTIQKMAEILETTPAYLMGWEDADGNEIPSTPSQLSDIDKEILQVFSLLSDADKKQALDYLAYLTKRDV